MGLIFYGITPLHLQSRLFSLIFQLVEWMAGSGSFQPILHGYAASAGFP
jgi:hypothetical protein